MGILLLNLPFQVRSKLVERLYFYMDGYIIPTYLNTYCW